MIVPVEIHLFCPVCLEDLDVVLTAPGELAVYRCGHCKAREMVEPIEEGDT